MAADLTRIKNYIQKFAFKDLFIDELGWDDHSQTLSILVDGDSFQLSAIAEKRGMIAFQCQIPKGTGFPLYQLRRKIESKVVKSAQQHIIIFTDAAKSRHIFQWVKREMGKPAACREHHYYSNQSGEGLAQKLNSIAFSLDEEEGLTHLDACFRVQEGLDVEKITKRFYDRFKKEHDAFLKLITGIPDKDMHQWYASVMLNRLMFIYFIQKKGFLDQDDSYLKNKLTLIKEKGKDRYYKEFLCPLFFDGFAKQKDDRSQKNKQLLGSVPYLNGGIFQKHQIEQHHGKTIEVPDKAFEKLYSFFDDFHWHLDERPMRDDKEINPDVLGYIFEKYINQKQMGAYYTKEDITEYISRNTIVPRLFDMAKEKCQVAFEGDQSVWNLLKADPDRYIFESVKKGVDKDLPKYIADGVDKVAKRTRWNEPAAEDLALPTEIWRETVARRQRYEEVKTKLKNGEIQSINDLITYNLDIRQFAQDVIEHCEGPELLRAIWRAIVGRIPEKSNEKFQQGISILDPTCGSGAFLFAALNILEPLYEACLDRMQAFVDELENNGSKGTEKYSDFKAILAEVHQHHNEKYFIYKSIIINNLFGVDIMEEAVEICKLRLFLKLVAQIDNAADLEPLPDIDFNIRAGNTLVGFASLDGVRDALKNDLIEQMALPEIEEQAQNVDRAYQRFRQMQTKQKMDSAEFTIAKETLNTALSQLESRLNGYLAGAYGLKENTKKFKEDYGKWIKSHQPFHWCIEFYGIIETGGFDVIIGNPPYLESREINYDILGLKSKESKAVHAMCIERSINLLSAEGCISMIVPLSIVSTQRMTMIQEILEDSKEVYYANFAWRPGKLFDTVNRALTIFVAIETPESKTYTTGYQKWNSDTRKDLITSMQYVEVFRDRPSFWVPKLSNVIEQSILNKVISADTPISDIAHGSISRIYYRTTGGLYWKVFTDFSPAFRVNNKKGHSSRETNFTVSRKEWVRPIIALLSSDIYWWWYTITSNLRDLNPSDIRLFPLPSTVLEDSQISRLGEEYINSLIENSEMLVRQQKRTGKTETQSFKVSKCKPIIDEIDKAFASHYGFTDEELDFIINYDIKYRMGKELNNEGDE